MTRASLLIAVLLLAAARPSAAADSTHVQLSGSIQATYTSAPGRAGDVVLARTIGSTADQFSLDQAGLTLSRSADTTRADYAFTITAITGTAVGFLKAEGLDLGPNTDLLEANISLALPKGASRWRFTAGKMQSFLGLEETDPTINGNLTTGLQYCFLLPATETGVSVAWQRAAWSAELRIANGWDVVEDPNKGRTFFARVALGDDDRSVSLAAYSGPEAADNESDLRSGAELTAWCPYPLGGLMVELDAGHDEALDASWWGAGLWATWEISGPLGLGLRADHIEDLENFREDDVHHPEPTASKTASSATLTLNWTPVPRFQLRPEARYDHANQPFFDGHDDQWTFTFGAAASF